MCEERLLERLQQQQVPFNVITHPEVATTQEAAAVGGISGYAFAKAVLVMADDRPQLYVLPAASRIDLDAMRGSVSSVRIATEPEVDQYFPGCMGAVPAVPLDAGLPVFMDNALMESDQIVFESGSSTQAIRMRMSDYLRVAAPVLQNFARMPRGTGRARRRRGPLLRGETVRRISAMAGAAALVALGLRMLGWLLPNRTSRTFAAGVTTGIAAAALADPRVGARRRALLRDRGMRSARTGAWWLGRKGRYARGKVEGARYGLRFGRRSPA
jgi:Ala-tRNA(Pro) deacylase